MTALTVFTFSGDWGLPSTGPFALKLIKWLELAGIPYRQAIENSPGKGPKGKNPWIELDGERIGDTEIIIGLLAKRSGFDIEAELSPEQKALSHAVRRMLEEHFHQVLEWELFAHANGAAYIRDLAATMVPRPLAGTAASVYSRRFHKQLHARGIARHSDEIIAAKGKADVDAVEALLGEKLFLVADRPSMADVTAYGLLMPMAKWPMRTPVADDIKRRPRLLAWLDRISDSRAEQRLAA
ncbi:MAG: glutathione S-transferase family protein [Devosia nanyangense]|uniref:Glutathione S-transferase family protein n=1 Tax=Devosia nanyangense TaxID=1228055 RepID=A0A933KZ95_9HYPH|nr:glutathione S-transferase family protein [Devosia nanyangense]